MGFHERHVVEQRIHRRVRLEHQHVETGVDADPAQTCQRAIGHSRANTATQRLAPLGRRRFHTQKQPNQ